MRRADPSGHPRVALVGPLNMDLFIRGSAPLDRDALNAWVGPSRLDLLVAGSIGYTTLALARLGTHVELHSSIGDDAFAGHICDALVSAGIETRFLAALPGETALAIYMMLFGGQKRPMTYRLPSFEPWPDPPALVRPGEPRPDLVHSGGLLHFPSMWHRGLTDAFRVARAAGVTTSIDPQFPLVDTPAPWLPHLADVLSVADVLLCDEGELAMTFATGESASDLAAAHAAGPGIVVVKRGAAGAIVSDGRRVIEQRAVSVPPEAVGEAVGAGDAFDAGFLDTLARGGSLEDAACFATAAAALTLRARGGAEGIASREAVLVALADVPASSERGAA